MKKLESRVASDLRLLASQWGWRLWRNNKGAGKLENGSFVRWGLCNDTPAIGSHMRSADYIGIRPVVIQQHHVGMTIGQFVSIEAKRENWKPSPVGPDGLPTDEHEAGQVRWRDLINSLGGYAVITNDPEKLP